jgi:hypothetical protein
MHTMKTLAIACAVLVAGLVGTTNAGDVSKSTLDAMGFDNATIMSDADGMEIRGKGTSASVWGGSIANYNSYKGNSSSVNGYDASAHHYYGSSKAKGSNLSFAGNYSSRYGLSVNFSGGKSQAYAR